MHQDTAFDHTLSQSWRLLIMAAFDNTRAIAPPSIGWIRIETVYPRWITRKYPRRLLVRCYRVSVAEKRYWECRDELSFVTPSLSWSHGFIAAPSLSVIAERNEIATAIQIVGRRPETDQFARCNVSQSVPVWRERISADDAPELSADTDSGNGHYLKTTIFIDQTREWRELGGDHHIDHDPESLECL